MNLVASFAAGLREHDRSEAAAIRSVFGDARVPVMNIKAGLGNNGAGSGAIDFIAAVLALHSGRIPPAFNSTPADPECPVNVVTDGGADARLKCVLSTAYALGGGQNAALVIRRFA